MERGIPKQVTRIGRWIIRFSASGGWLPMGDSSSPEYGKAILFDPSQVLSDNFLDAVLFPRSGTLEQGNKWMSGTSTGSITSLGAEPILIIYRSFSWYPELPYALFKFK